MLICYKTRYDKNECLYGQQARDIKLKAKHENKREEKVIQELFSFGPKTAKQEGHESTGESLLRLAAIGGKGPANRYQRSYSLRHSNRSKPRASNACSLRASRSSTSKCTRPSRNKEMDEIPVRFDDLPSHPHCLRPRSSIVLLVADSQREGRLALEQISIESFP